MWVVHRKSSGRLRRDARVQFDEAALVISLSCRRSRLCVCSNLTASKAKLRGTDRAHSMSTATQRVPLKSEGTMSWLRSDCTATAGAFQDVGRAGSFSLDIWLRSLFPYFPSRHLRESQLNWSWPGLAWPAVTDPDRSADKRKPQERFTESCYQNRPWRGLPQQCAPNRPPCAHGSRPSEDRSSEPYDSVPMILLGAGSSGDGTSAEPAAPVDSNRLLRFLEFV